jgi:membrane-associated phospholipid phosphatase
VGQNISAVRRRPSGEPPPLPRPAWWPKLAIGLAITIFIGLLLGVVYANAPPDEGFLEPLTELRADWLVDIAKGLSWFASPAGIIFLRLVFALVLIYFRRWRHLAVTIGTFAVFDAVVFPLVRITLPIPDVDIVVEPASGTYYFPASGIASMTITLGSMVWSLAPAGRIRKRAVIAAVAFAVLVALARCILGAAYPSAALYSVVLGFTVTAVAFGWLTPSDAFPVSYTRGGNTAHLDLEGERKQAVIAAMRAQLGLEVVELKPFGQEGSAGSTPLLMTTADGRRIFGKILSLGHVRADRWYRIGRTIMYGRLEDETSFSSVRRLILAEDHALRLLDDLGFKVAHSYGLIELTPHVEYLLPTEFFEGAETLGHADVTDEIIDDGIALVRKLWDAGLAHRDIKPANLLVVNGRLQVIDVSGLQVRPSPWRQAVDLANMMLVLGLRSDPERVYQSALRSFTPEEIGEAFAAAQGMAIPTELQRHLKEDDRDLVGRFRELAPPHPKISIQRWSFQRIGLTLATVAGALLTISWAVSVYFGVLD